MPETSTSRSPKYPTHPKQAQHNHAAEQGRAKTKRENTEVLRSRFHRDFWVDERQFARSRLRQRIVRPQQFRPTRDRRYGRELSMRKMLGQRRQVTVDRDVQRMGNSQPFVTNCAMPDRVSSWHRMAVVESGKEDTEMARVGGETGPRIVFN